jgi:hypothetical protein
MMGNVTALRTPGIPMTISDGFFAWVDAIFFLEKEAQAI